MLKLLRALPAVALSVIGVAAVSVLTTAIVAGVLSWPAPASAGSPCSIPKSWGAVRAAHAGTYGIVYVLEAEDGTLRSTTAASCKAIETLPRSAD